LFNRSDRPLTSITCRTAPSGYLLLKSRSHATRTGDIACHLYSRFAIGDRSSQTICRCLPAWRILVRALSDVVANNWLDSVCLHVNSHQNGFLTAPILIRLGPGDAAPTFGCRTDLLVMRAVATREFPFIPLEAIRAAGLELSAALSMGRTEVGAARDRYQSRIFPPGFTGIRYLVVGGRFDRAAKRALPAINASIVEGRTR